MAANGDPPDDLDVPRPFGVCDVQWSVRDVSLLTFGPGWSLLSPAFPVRGCTVTHWRLSLSPAVLTLERRDDGPDSVRVQWKMSVHVSWRQIFERQGSCDLVEGDGHPVNLETLMSSIEAIRSFDSDHMTIRCKMIVQDGRERKQVFGPSVDRAMAELSEDLSEIFSGGADCDLRLRIGEASIRAHKAVACARIPLLGRLLEEAEVVTEGDDREVDVVDVSFLDHDAALKIVQYAYSGDPAHVLREPSLALYESAHSLDMRQLKNVYCAKRLHFRTLLADVQETRFTWTVAKFFEECSGNNSLMSPRFVDDFYRISDWQLRLFDGKNGYISVAAEERDDSEIAGRHLFVQFSIEDEDERFVFSKLLRAEGGLRRPVRVDKFIRRSTLRAFLVGTALRLTLKVKLVAGLQPTTYEERLEIPALPNYTMDPFRLLSREMLDSLARSDFADVRLRCGPGGASLGVARCIVGARCPSLLHLIDNSEERDAEGCVRVRDMEWGVLRLLLKYIYGGVLLPERPEDRARVPQLLEAAVRFRLPLLENLCQEMLARVENRRNV